MDFPETPGMYVLSFDMKRPMVYYQYRPQSKRYVDSSMIKVGKCKNIKKRMNDYMKTYGYREFEPPPTKDYWIKKGFKDNYLRRCLGCDLKEPHHHVIFEYVKEVEFLEEQDRKEIEKELKKIYREANIFGEYYHKDAKKSLIASLKTLIQSYN
tara:strand:- start:649 stop:1110 length:462 start_codon:yes stop_codon:yes gene_type:complete